ncbi:MAG TPA: type II toxin-antitoxin system RelE/ParE family toxin [Candidatus Acidoferrales bacterium]|nr:type II toxin-antitoxin system RelE/ParE family toxin [Candidatus Acidoferrales bacterium]
MATPYAVRVKNRAERELNRLPRKEIDRIINRLQQLALDPRPHGCEKLSGVELYRIRQGDYRVLYTIDDDAQLVEVVKIGHRREVYR